MKFRSVPLLFLIFLILGGSLPAHPTQAKAGDSTFGVEIRNFDALPQAIDANNNWLRYNGLLWSEYQPSNSSQFIRNTALENNLIAAHNAGMEVILIIRSTPTWARMYANYACGPMKSANIGNFANFMKQVVETYSVAPYIVKYYELWNEPDEYREWISPEWQVFGCWGNPSDTYFGGGYYANMLKQVHPAVKAANPNAQVVLGGLLLPVNAASSFTVTAPSGISYNYFKQTRFFEGILHNGGGPFFDYVSFHGYTFYDTTYPTGILMERYEHWWDEDGGQVKGKFDYINGLMKNYGISKPILMTEAALALPDGFKGNINIFEAKKADYLLWVYVRNITLGIKGTTWYHMDNYGWRNSGLLDSNNDPLPAYKAYQVMTHTLTGANPPTKLSGLPTNVVGFNFLKGTTRIWVLFSVDGTPKTVNKPAWFSHVYDLLKNPPLNQTASTITFDRPIYIDNLPNHPPKFTSAPINTTINQNSLFSYRITIEDEDYGDSHTIIPTASMPGWLTILSNLDGSWTLRGTPGNADVGTHTFFLTVKDSGGLTDGPQKAVIKVNNVNDPPYFTSTPVTQATEGEVYTYNITATDPDWLYELDPLTISAITIPSWLSLTPTGNGTATLTGTPTAADLEDPIPIKLQVQDSHGAKGFQSYTIGDLPVYLPLFMR